MTKIESYRRVEVLILIFLENALRLIELLARP